ncbi:hypothetical protein STENM223S_09472 [Streptomyces tendae]
MKQTTSQRPESPASEGKRFSKTTTSYEESGRFRQLVALGRAQRALVGRRVIQYGSRRCQATATELPSSASCRISEVVTVASSGRLSDRVCALVVGPGVILAAVCYIPFSF